MPTFVGKILFSRLMFWVVILLAGCYFLFPNLLVRGVKNRFAMPRVSLGIDLRGGTYITLGVDIDKVIENRLNAENRYLAKVFKDKKVKALPKKTEVKTQQLVMTFDDEEAAKIVYNIVGDMATALKVQRRDATIVATLTPAEDSRLRTESVEQARQVIKSRVDGFGVMNPLVQRHGAKQIVIQLPGVDDPERVKKLITKRAHLEFKLVQDQGTNKDALLDKFDGDLPSDLAIISGELGSEDVADDETQGKWYLVSAFPDLTGDHVVDANVGYDEFHRPYVSFRLDRAGGRIFRELTGNNIGTQLAIIIDNVVFSAPNISTVIGSNGQISRSGGFTLKEAKDLALVLRTGSFQAPVTYQEERRIGPSLGQDSINKGIMSCLVGLVLVVLFSIFMYKIPGFFAMLALLFNLFLILLFLSFFEATLTLPGIAGIVLTIGMAIDAAILIYERIKEEVATGSPFRKALNDGFSGAMVVIFDSNITTFLTGGVLYYFGGPSIQGFAITLMLGIIATLLSSVFFLKSLFLFVLDVTPIKKLSF